jgi:hypothetical protein
MDSLGCPHVFRNLCWSLSILGAFDRHIYVRAIEGAEVEYVGEN